MPQTTTQELARESIDAFNRSDWQATRDLSSPQYVYEETGTGRRCEGIDEAVAALQEWKAALPDGTGEVTRIVGEGDLVVLEIIWRGTQTGDLRTPTGTLPASGKAFQTWATLWQRWENGKLVEARHHLDILSLLGQLGQLGAFPAPAAATGRS